MPVRESIEASTGMMTRVFIDTYYESLICDQKACVLIIKEL